MRFAVTGEVSLDCLRQPGLPAWTGLGGCATYLSLALARLGARVLFATVAGEDVPADYLEPLRRAGVELHLRHLAGLTARLDLTYDQHGDISRLVFDGGVESQLDAGQLPPQFWQVDWVVVGTAPHTYQHQVIERGRRLGRRTALSTQREFDSQWAALAAMLPCLNVLFANSNEVVQLRGDPLDVALHTMRGLNPQLTCIVTCGERGALLLHGDRLWQVAACPYPALDTTGAGDAFAAAWLTSWTGGSAMPAALRTAALAASLAMRGPAHTRLADPTDIAHAMSQMGEQSPEVMAWVFGSQSAQDVLVAEDMACHRLVDRQVTRG
jgi:sugar/nucleoside kinase (ribokinase family)